MFALFKKTIFNPKKCKEFMKFELSIGVVETSPIYFFQCSSKRTTYLSFGYQIHITETLIHLGVRQRKARKKRIMAGNVHMHPYEKGNEATSLIFSVI
jgi:hypothetical protein